MSSTSQDRPSDPLRRIPQDYPEQFRRVELAVWGFALASVAADVAVIDLALRRSAGVEIASLTETMIDITGSQVGGLVGKNLLVLGLFVVLWKGLPKPFGIIIVGTVGATYVHHAVTLFLSL